MRYFDKMHALYQDTALTRHSASSKKLPLSLLSELIPSMTTVQPLYLDQTTKMADSEVDELNALFASSLTSGLESDVLAELQSIMRLHSIPPQELFYKWESYSMKMGADGARLDIINARALKQDIQESLEKENRNKAHLRSTEKRVGGTPRNIINSGDVFGMYVLKEVQVAKVLTYFQARRARSQYAPGGSTQ